MMGCRTGIVCHVGSCARIVLSGRSDPMYFSQSIFKVLVCAFAVSGSVQVVTIIDVSGSVVWVVTTLYIAELTPDTRMH